MDTFVLNAITQELQQQICLAKINHISQPDEQSVILGLWQRGQELRLAISVDARYQYLFLTRQPAPNQVFNFGKFLQHHIKNAEIRAIQKPLLERIITFDLVKKDIDGQDLKFRLVLEIMGRYSNLILINQDTNKILDSLQHVTAVQSSYRRIAPGAEYVPPPLQEKEELLNIDQTRFQQILADYEQEAQTSASACLWKFLIQRIGGLSPLLAKEIEGAHLDTSAEARWQRLSELIRIVREGAYQPTLILEQGQQGKQKPLALSAIPLAEFPHGKTCDVKTPDSMNAAAEQYYTILVERQRYDTLKATLMQPLTARLAKARKKREHLLAQKQQIDQAEDYKRQGELITTNLYQLSKGMNSARVIDYYSEDQALIEIPLDPKFTPAQNAQRYFKRYSKLKQGSVMTEQRLAATEQELAYLEEVQFFVEDAQNFYDLQQLRAEMEAATPSKSKKKSVSKSEPAKPAQPFLRFVSSDGFDIYVGRSSRENDLLTQRTALPEDVWLHVHKAPGSHVLILNRERKTPVPDQTLREAASLAAYYSKLRRSGRVDVIYTSKKYVRKPKGSPPGLVIVQEFQTLRVIPQANLTAK
ncbi:fibronectin-binding A domain protein [Candidatus Vecturithrix granuli]|uniref:Rqc2 homolog RqcH n=1 Tax=Vecturithrix granuli TaxID=1499967 RepID=A0A081C5X1_VECG1|nr:fibronectin-binding A domain protein [Candidatus Vecturithrix granuli]